MASSKAKKIPVSTCRQPTNGRAGERMSIDSRIPELEHLTFKVLEERNEADQSWVATCLETGAVATADSLETLHELIMETIQLEVLLAVKNNDFPNLFRRAAPGEVAAKWYRAAGMSGGGKDDSIEIDLSGFIARREVQSERIFVKTALYEAS